MRTFTLLPFLTISMLLSPFGAQDSPGPWRLIHKPSQFSKLELEPSEVESIGFPSETQITELCDNDIEDYLNEDLDKEDYWNQEKFQIRETPKLLEDFKDKIRFQCEPRRKILKSGFREIREEKQERIRQKRQVYNRNYQRNPQQQVRRGSYQVNNNRRNQNFRGNRRQIQYTRNQFRGNARPNQYRGYQGSRNFYDRNMNNFQYGQGRGRVSGRGRNQYRQNRNRGLLGFLGLGDLRNFFGFGGFNRDSQSRIRGRSRNRGVGNRNWDDEVYSRRNRIRADDDSSSSSASSASSARSSAHSSIASNHASIHASAHSAALAG